MKFLCLFLRQMLPTMPVSFVTNFTVLLQNLKSLKSMVSPLHEVFSNFDNMHSCSNSNVNLHTKLGLAVMLSSCKLIDTNIAIRIVLIKRFHLNGCIFRFRFRSFPVSIQFAFAGKELTKLHCFSAAVEPKTPIKFAYIPGHLYHMLFELFKVRNVYIPHFSPSERVLN